MLFYSPKMEGLLKEITLALDLNVYGEGLHCLEATDGFTANLFKKTGHETSVLWFIQIILHRSVIPDKSFVKNERFDYMKIMRCVENAWDIDDVAESFN